MIATIEVTDTDGNLILRSSMASPSREEMAGKIERSVAPLVDVLRGAREEWQHRESACISPIRSTIDAAPEHCCAQCGIDRSDKADARRMRWLLDGNGYYMEEQGLCGGPTSEKKQDSARSDIDEEIALNGSL